jgi:RES domain-containing protein
MPTPNSDFPRWYAILSDPAAAPRVPWAGDVFRATLPKWMSKPYRLTAVGSVLTGGRWNVRSLVPALNFGTTADVTAAEADAKARRSGWPPGALSPQTRVAFQLDLRAILDLTDVAVLKALRLRKRDLVDCDWEAEQLAGREALTQAVARAAFETFAEGLLVPSARLAGGVNVIVFPTHLQPPSSIQPLHEAAIPFVHGL